METNVRDKLVARRQELLERVQRVNRDLRHESDPLVQDADDQAIQRENDDVLLSIGDAASAELRDIDNALRRLAEGEDVRCARCGGQIEARRLSALPQAVLCARCASRTDT